MTGPLMFEIGGRRYRATMSTGEVAELFGCSPERLQNERGRGTLANTFADLLDDQGDGQR